MLPRLRIRPPSASSLRLPLHRTRRLAALAPGLALVLAGSAAAAAPAARAIPAAPGAVLHDATVVTDGTLYRGAAATVHVTVTGARSLTDSRPIAGARVELSLVAVPDRRVGGPPSRPRHLASATADAGGHAALRFRVPPVDPGAYQLVIRTRSAHGADTTERPVEVEDRVHLHLRTDRGVYQAGQTIRWRVTAVSGADAHPVSGDEVELTARDPRGTAIWRGTERLPRHGMIAGAIPLGEDLLNGRYALTARLRGIEARETVEVKQVRLPGFEVSLARRGAAPASGERRRFLGRITARYPYGEPVRGEVKVGTDREIGRLLGTLDAQGQLAFELPLEPDDTRVRASVTDGAGRTHEASIELPRRSDRIQVALVPESSILVAGRRHWFTVLSTDGDGALSPARVVITGPDGRRITRESPGAIRVALRMPERPGRQSISAGAVRADGAMDLRTSSVYTTSAAPIVRPRAAVITAGQPVVIEGAWPGARGPLLATLLRGGVPVAVSVARLDRRGRLRAELRPPEGSFGLATVRLVELGWDRERPGEERIGHHVNVYLRPATLDVRIAAETRHRPGQRAVVGVTVRDAAGRPVPGAALAASVVDERVLALSPPRPDLAAALRSLDSVRDATSLGIAFADLLVAPATPQRDAALRAILEALPPEAHDPSFAIPAEVRYLAESARIGRAAEAVRPLLVTGGVLGARDRNGRWRYRAELHAWLGHAGWKQPDRLTPWGVPTGWRYAAVLDPELAFDRLAPQISEERLAALAEGLRRRGGRTRAVLLAGGSDALAALAGRTRALRGLAVDPWGTPIRVEREGGPLHPLESTVTIALRSAGPDQIFETDDDHQLADVFFDLGMFGTVGYGSGGGGAGFGRGSGTASLRTSAGAVNAAPLRARFDETVLWRVGVPTGPDGAAELEVDLSDSITGWRIAIEAVSPAGAIGAAESRLETFLPLHLDAEVPPRLAVGDSYRIPIAVANHSGAPRALEVTAELGGALRRRGPARHALSLADGQTGVVYVRAAAHRAGPGLVRLRLAAGDTEVDRVERTITVEPPGELQRAIHAADIPEAGARIRFTAPGGAAAGSTRAVLRVFRGAADQALDGLDGMLAEPYGCFEQASSTTYPNLLVLRLVKDAPGMAAVRARARTLVGRGYQRLISYEVPGGGFSWFGETPANQVLTAYGLMEFVDMAAVYPVDPALIERTRAWLASQQQPDGSWKPDASWLHDWSEVQGKVSTTAYIAWAMAEAGERGRPLDRALAYLARHRAELARDPYLLSLWAAAETAVRGARSTALPLLVRRGERTESGGLVFRAGGKTLFYASGEAADAQVTAMAATALKRAGREADARAALDWLWQARSPSYGWGTTQSTVLALRAAALAAPPPPATEGTLAVRLGRREIGRIDLAAAGIPTIELPALAAGDHQLSIDGPPGGGLRADLRLSWRAARVPGAVATGLEVALEPGRATSVGGRRAMTARLHNPGADTVAMPTAVIPVPPGFGVDPDSLDRLRRIRGVSKVEDLGDSIAVYLTELAPGGRVALPYALEARAEVDVLQRPAVAYAYYTPELRGSSAAIRLRSGTRAATAPATRAAGSALAAPNRHRSPLAALER